MPIEKFTKIQSSAVPLDIENIDTDQIIPARFLKAVERKGFGDNLFRDWRFDKSNKLINTFPLNDSKYTGQILIGGKNFGCGSSREHAPQALLRWGIKAIIGESFADIFYSNCIAIGIPCFTLSSTSIKIIQNYIDKNDLFFEIDLFKKTASSIDLKFNLEIKETSRKMFLSGEWDTTSILIDNNDLIENKLNDLPYIKFNSNF